MGSRIVSILDVFLKPISNGCDFGLGVPDVDYFFAFPDFDRI